MSETDSFSNGKFESLLEIWTENLKGNVFIKPPENKGWLEKRNTNECWISNKMFRGSATWKKKYFSVQLFDVIMRYLGILFSKFPRHLFLRLQNNISKIKRSLNIN